MVSGSVSLPSPGFFSPFPHGTVPYRSPDPFSLGTWSSRLPTRFLVAGGTRVVTPNPGRRYAYGALTPSGGPSQGLRLPTVRRSAGPIPRPGHATPRRRIGQSDHSAPAVWAPPVSLAATSGISGDFLVGG